MKRKNKYEYMWVIQFRCDGGTWEDVGSYPKSEYQWKDVAHDLKEYRISGYGEYRVINRREKNK